MSDNIKVVVKVRPLISRELEDKLSYQWRVKNNTLYQLDHSGKDFGACFTFDKVYDKETKTCDIYNDIAKPIVEAATAGFNGTIFAYGQTSSGKTYTMKGTEDSPGIIPLAVYNLFQIIKKIPDRDFLVRVSYIEIYNETLKDLLNVNKNVKVFESLQGGVNVDCTEQVTTSPEEVLKYLKEGEAYRQTGATNMNEESSRSHSIFQIIIESREHIEGEEEVGCVNVSHLNLVDLAGSERAGQTGATGKRFKEGTHINKSLSALALVIKQLSEGQNKHVSYRDSKLTRILQNSLGGNAKTSIICAITPAAVEETISTLQFANRAKSIKNKPEVNAVATDATMIQTLTKQLSKLQSQLESKKNLEIMLESKKNVEQDNYNLQKQIAALQRLILNGFGSRSSMDMMSGSRRKLVQPRRVTISTLHPIDENPAPTVPKFHTPLLKYNSMLMPGANDFVPIQNANKLTSLPEEGDNRLITPPPPDKKVNCNDEIIDLDSDDDNSTLDTQTCSPYHKCWSSKTPPCVLRKNAKLAETNLKDIVELTEREKMYTPNVVELMEKLEENNGVITRLQDEVNSLSNKSKEKDLEIDLLKVKVSKSTEEIKSVNLSKAELEALCKEYTTKLTDWEVSYETLKSKSKRREDDLLSLLEEQKTNKKVLDTSKIIVKNIEKELNFMDMSKDISLVNSDSECSMNNINDDDIPSQARDTTINMQNQLTHKNQSILALEEELLSQKNKVISLETSNQELQKIIDRCKEKIALLENENSLLKSSTETLNSTIINQKSNLESAYNDIESYNSVIQELQIKLSDKEKIKTLHINEVTLEKMIANEEKFIANNENMKNIIHSFTIALESRNKEIESLKSLVDKDTNSPGNDISQEQLDDKEKEIQGLKEEANRLQDQIDQNVCLINKLMQEKSNLADLEHQLTNQLTNITQQLHQLEKSNKEKDVNINNLNEKLLDSINEKNNIEREFLSKTEDTKNIIETLNDQILHLQGDIKVKDNLILSLNVQDSQNQEYIFYAKAILNLLSNMIFNLTGNKELPDSLDNLNDIFDYIKNNLNTLESTVMEITSQKDSKIENYIAQTTQLQCTNNALESVITDLKLNLNEFQETNSELVKQCEYLRQELQSKNHTHSDLENKLTETNAENEKLRSDILTLKEQEKYLNSEIDKMGLKSGQKLDELRQQIANLNDEINLKKKNIDDLLQDKDTKIKYLESSVNKIENHFYEMENLRQTVQDTIEQRNFLINNILQHVLVLNNTLNITNENKPNDDITPYDHILTILNTITTHFNTRKIEDDRNIDEAIEEKEALNKCVNEKRELNTNLTEMDAKNKLLMARLEEIQLENKALNENAYQGNVLLETLKMELKQKANEIEIMVNKTHELKNNFKDLDFIVKDLRADNKKLTMRCSELELNTNVEILNRDSESKFYDIDIKKSITEHVPMVDSKSPPSLLTICCNKIVETIQPSEKSVSTSDSNTSLYYDNEAQTSKCNCNRILADLKAAEIENINLTKTVNQLQALNEHLISDREQVRQEVQLLLEPAFELQRKINSHKTNLSTLTATTYAENKSLRSQVKVLQHHHSRFHKVCQRDLPVVKKQLCDLMSILKSENSLVDKHNASFKRYSLPSVLLDHNSTLNNLKNESTLDGDLLMLDTNLTLMTTTDATLMGLDQTCLDVTQVYSNIDVGCQTPAVYTDHVQIDASDNDRQLYEKIQALETENQHLKEQINSDVIMKESIDAQSSPLKMDCEVQRRCEECESLKTRQQSLQDEIKILSQKLVNAESQKTEFENKYNNLTLEIPATDALVKKISIFEREFNGKVHEIEKLSNLLSSKNHELKQLQEENDALSTQFMESVTETDELNKELNTIKVANEKLSEKCSNFEKSLQDIDNKEKPNCSQCQSKDVAINTLQNIEVHSKLNRSLSDSDTSSRYNKICTLQSELHAGREDCKELKEEVTVIRNQLERSNLSMGQNMDLDDSMSEPNIFAFTKHFVNVGVPNKYSDTNTSQESNLDYYAVEKHDCINYFVEKTGIDKENLDSNVKIIDIMKMFYSNCIVKHNNDVENLVNKIKCYDETRNQLEKHVNELTAEYDNVTKTMKEKDNAFQKVTNTLSQISQNISMISKEIPNFNGRDTQFVAAFKDGILNIMDNEFGFSSVPVFENLVKCLINKHQIELSYIINDYQKLQANMDAVTAELNVVNDNLSHMKSQLTDKENEYNVLKTKNERIHEISNAVTLDLVKKEQEICEIIVNSCKQLVENNVISPVEIDLNWPLNKNISHLFERLLNELKGQPSQIQQDRDKLQTEINKFKSELEENLKEKESLKVEYEKLKDINNAMTLNLANKDKEIISHMSMLEELNNKYVTLVAENKYVNTLVEKTNEEIKALKENLLEKEEALQFIKSNESSSELFKKELASYKNEIDNLKTINEVIIKEKETAALELEESKELLRRNTAELDKMTADILVLRESVKENVSIVETLKLEAKSLLQQNIQLKEKFDEKCRDCSRLEMNIKTHEKTAEIQSKMIMRLQKQKDIDDHAITEKDKQLADLTQRISDLQKDSDSVRKIIDATRAEMDSIKNAKEALEIKLSEVELDLQKVNKPRLSIDATSESTRRRRQSIHDSKRMFSENQDLADHNKMEAMFASQTKPADFFMDVDEDNSNRSTPLRSSKGRESLLSKHDQSDEPLSRPSSVAETRRRRQSIHDLHRSVVQQTPSPHERPSSRLSESSNVKSNDFENKSMQSEVYQLRERLSACQQELEELKEQYRELDEECDTCAQYLRERDEQCARLKKEKATLENLVTDLKEKLQSANPNGSQLEKKPELCHAAVNTDEDWANLHSVVVDRMSFDAEVDKNKRLTKTIEELRFKKQDLKVTLAKMQRALEKNSSKDHSKELEMAKMELKACKQELKELKERYKELDEECETCATYLREREEQCRKLKEAKAALEAKLQEFQDSSSITQSQRKKRQSAHDQNRSTPDDFSDASTQVGDDFLNNQVERDSNSRRSDDKSEEIRRLKLAVDRLCQQKSSLEHQLAAASAVPSNPMYIATGSAIVQNQQLTDVMKENQKLKKINTKLMVKICEKRGKKIDAVNEESSERALGK